MYADIKRTKRFEGSKRIGYYHQRYKDGYSDVYDLTYVLREVNKLVDNKSYVEILDVKGANWNRLDRDKVYRMIPNILPTDGVFWVDTPQDDDDAPVIKEDLVQRSVINGLRALPPATIVYINDHRKYTATDMMFEVRTTSALGSQFALEVMKSSVEEVAQKCLPQPKKKNESLKEKS